MYVTDAVQNGTEVEAQRDIRFKNYNLDTESD